MTTNLVVADPTRLENTICLAVSPSMKALGVKNRCLIKDIPGNIKHIVAQPRMQLYIDCAAEIYAVFLKYIAPEDIHLEGENSREKLKDFAQYIIPFIRDFSFSEEGQRYISEWMKKHPRFGDDEEDIYDDDEEDDDY